MTRRAKGCPVPPDLLAGLPEQTKGHPPLP